MAISKDFLYLALEFPVQMYYAICRLLRNRFKWSCKDIDSISVRRLMNIYEETLEDIDKEKNEMDGIR